ncbi:MAG: autotransporter-associated beta strand repeat-containing protein [Gloeobacteraceae cyanobacterium ES-bin-144]|nr:autotransporter-associated beta strand repeat-containing protein [Verrucomicrobiales bacterium]
MATSSHFPAATSCAPRLSGTTTINSALELGNSAIWSLSGGLLQISGGVAGNNRDITISGSGAVTINSIIATASGKINATGTGLLTLTGSNTYTDTTKISAGSVINIQNSNALGTTAGITDIDNGGALQLQGNISVGTEDLTLFGSGISNTGALRNISGNNSWAGKITLDNATAIHRINSDSGTLTLNGVITEAGKADNKDLTFGGAGNITVNGAIAASNGDMILSKEGTGLLVLNGVNTFRGSVTITDGILSVATIGNGGASGNLGRATNIASNLIFDGGTLRYTGATASSDRNFTINAGKTAVFDITTNNLTFSGVSSATSGGLTKMGAGTLTFGGANLHTGTTTVKAGTLKLTGSGNLASTNIIVGDAGSSGAILDATTKTGGMIIGNGKTLSGIGTINATTTIQGTISPGNSGPGVLTNVGNIDLQSGSIAEFQLNGATAGTLYDQLKVTGSATLSGALSISMGYTPAINTLYFVFVNDGTDALTGTFSNAAVNGSVYTLGGQQFKVSYFGNFEAGIPSFTGGNDFVLMAVPEPSVGLSLLGATVLLVRRRRTDLFRNDA